MKIAIAGASGRMGRMLIEAVLNDSDAQLVGALDRADSPFLGQDAGAFLGKATGVLLIRITLSREFIISLIPAGQQGIAGLAVTGPLTFVTTFVAPAP